jgi:hypothetical protein
VTALMGLAGTLTTDKVKSFVKNREEIKERISQVENHSLLSLTKMEVLRNILFNNFT